MRTNICPLRMHQASAALHHNIISGIFTFISLWFVTGISLPLDVSCSEKGEKERKKSNIVQTAMDMLMESM